MPILIIALPIIYFLIYFYIKSDNEKLRSLASVFSYKHNINNAYVEYRQWKIAWGLLIDSQIEVNRVIDEWNDNGYICISFQRSFLPNVPIIKIIMIFFITFVTFGFVNFYVGPTMLFVLSGFMNKDLKTNNNERNNDFNKEHCKQCGKKLQDDDIFCIYCGTKVK